MTTAEKLCGRYYRIANLERIDDAEELPFEKALRIGEAVVKVL